MSIAIIWEDGLGTFAMNGMDFLTDNSVTTDVIISLFTDRRAEPSDALPDGSHDRRGWWADSYRRRPIGSRLWLLSREKTLTSVLRRAKNYAEEALAWMKTAGLITALQVEATVPRHGVLHLAIRLTLPDGAITPFVFKATFKGF
ncbi:phage protein GP46 [Edwardsiella anguillarum ET080813]|uniref:Phage protein GP46 n=2 Tax=Edwardsiella anguillarum TaxID=1821960 RepID=A0A076LUK2_9GAMM|nr:phage protein GP46 [Edwardsiella anguillarum ET080813]